MARDEWKDVTLILYEHLNMDFEVESSCLTSIRRRFRSERFMENLSLTTRPLADM